MRAHWTFPLWLAVICLFVTSAVFLFSDPVAPSHSPRSKEETELSALRAEVDRLKGLVPDQSHAMEDVAYHFGI